MKTQWKNTRLQAVRVVGEILSTQTIDYNALCESMDISKEDLTSLLDRIADEWDTIKSQLPKSS
jgi:hypothetical protein